MEFFKLNAAHYGSQHNNRFRICYAELTLITTSKSNWVVGVQALHDNPYDGHTLKDAINQMEKIVGLRPKEVYVLNHSRNSASHFLSRPTSQLKRILESTHIFQVFRQE
ncbi:hypothetical protein LEP1GSC021_1187 [Leptospira noguchii str. 1993005606]|uniref:Uncharacterized protein n=2 Tax=Leptospira noguchii TaxID=28182 RepID=M6YXS1_9LEPT|nr:hypothetical protein LEP1GSC035_3326 [Leptospira noguchii str. 2007001578]EMO91133.1 hypothetical protein LEP1GSC024_2062 [Leptospira noguchii str. 2001034031]EPE81918.1 hypothetical protein LEP1GSC021_1187 [Leptospira noguchii str. 1993005606]